MNNVVIIALVILIVAFFWFVWLNIRQEFEMRQIEKEISDIRRATPKADNTAPIYGTSYATINGRLCRINTYPSGRVVTPVEGK